uniref:SGNH hydrolase-type esterase domain-containing protein n=2 Tax=Emiliania huxleyi TaxID=2903 RepID=A0A6V2T2T6_EMIHU
MVGTNDLGAGESWRVVADELVLVMEQLHAARPAATLLLQAILPRGGDAWLGGRRLRTPWWDDAETNSHYHAVTTLNGRLAAYAWKRPWVRWVDCGDRFLAPGYAPADQAASATPDGDLMLAEPLGAPHARAHQVKRNASSAAGPGGRHLQPHLMYDLLHLTPEGYTRWAECLRPAIAEAFAWNANRTRRQ